MDFASIAWWAYLLTALIGIGFGVLQSLLMKRSMLGEKPKKWLYFVKVGLWAVALVAFAIISVPLMLVFAVVASVSMIVASALVYQKVRKEAR